MENVYVFKGYGEKITYKGTSE